MPKKGRKGDTGVCRLTGQPGRFAKSHIFPRALTKPEFPGGLLLQAGGDGRPKRRRTSWYDTELVTYEGERFLGELDDFAVKELRAHALVWSGFGPRSYVPPDLSIESPSKPGVPVRGVRQIAFSDANRLSRWLSSILWRSASSSLPEMSEIAVSDVEDERLRAHVLGACRDGGFPASLIQLSTIGSAHNSTPFADSVTMNHDLAQISRPIFRFYLDGLVIHFHRNASAADLSGMGSMIVGASDKTVVISIPFEQSFQHKNLVSVLSSSAPFIMPFLNPR